jgi:hypothetical protein
MAKVDYAAIFKAADMAGREAAEKCVPPVMVVADADLITGAPIPGGKRFVVPGGPCGFAWVTAPGNSGFGKWMVKVGKARKSSLGGVRFSIFDYGQSMMRKEEYAYAFANKARELGMPKVYAESRMD